MNRDKNRILYGDLVYERRNWPITVLSSIPPILYPCTNCGSITLHVVGEQPTGIGIQIPFTKKPLASTGRGYHLICNECTTISTQLKKETITMLESRIIPVELCDPIDAYFRADPNCPIPYTKEFPNYFVNQCPPGIDNTYLVFITTILSVYRRNDMA
ncbi:MAG: hypothetical protein JXB10_01390 [Pirellulales bacterium]|nr:hypothetical protein [Pirellulales bacterium]